ncbi:MAG TPA: hypothetical protein VHV32_16990 [Candidatus Angelobacter sp.]|jgi:hypothetical protein|nr:hypothetical protein [Candidatus Angelobacter sp.]
MQDKKHHIAFAEQKLRLTEAASVEYPYGPSTIANVFRPNPSYTMHVLA